MNLRAADKAFSGSIPQIYDALLVPLIFEPFAADLAVHVAQRRPERVLEMAAGTGVTTRALDAALGGSSAIVATDLNQAMLERAAIHPARRVITWRQADAQQLPFADGSFDAVVCQFGVMFFPDKIGAYHEARRVLAPGGFLIFNVWDRIEENDFAATVTEALAMHFAADPPRFLARTPHGYHDTATIARDLAAAGFAPAPRCTTLAARSRAADCEIAAAAFCQGTPLRNAIEARAPAGVSAATAVAAAALARRFGRGPVDGALRAHIMLATSP